MPWRITYWHGKDRVRQMTVEDGSPDEITAMLEKLAIKRMDFDQSEGSDQTTSRDQESPEVRVNRSGSMLWTTGQAFHYTAEWYVRGPRKG